MTLLVLLLFLLYRTRRIKLKIDIDLEAESEGGWQLTLPASPAPIIPNRSPPTQPQSRSAAECDGPAN
jgi:hypothetical protein